MKKFLLAALVFMLTLSPTFAQSPVQCEGPSAETVLVTAAAAKAEIIKIEGEARKKIIEANAIGVEEPFDIYLIGFTNGIGVMVLLKDGCLIAQSNQFVTDRVKEALGL